MKCIYEVLFFYVIRSILSEKGVNCSFSLTLFYGVYWGGIG